jgi:hypothetical protein
MKSFSLILTAALSTLFVAQISSANTKAFCAGTAGNVHVSLDVDLGDSLSTFKLSVTDANNNTVDSAGTLQVGGGDGMMRAFLESRDTAGDIVNEGTFTWWVVPTITPRISLTGQTNPIMLNCQDLWPQQ